MDSIYSVYLFGFLAFVFIFAPILYMVYTWFAIGGEIDWLLTLVGGIWVLTGLIIAYFKVYLPYKAVEEVRN